MTAASVLLGLHKVEAAADASALVRIPKVAVALATARAAASVLLRLPKVAEKLATARADPAGSLLA